MARLMIKMSTKHLLIALVFVILLWDFTVLASTETKDNNQNCDENNILKKQKVSYTRYLSSINTSPFCSTDSTPILGTAEQKWKEVPRPDVTEANWKLFTEELDTRILNIEASPKNYDLFAKTVWEVSFKNNIKTGTRSILRVGLDPISLKPNKDTLQEADARNDSSTCKGKVNADQVANLLVENGEITYQLPEFPKVILSPTTEISKPFTLSEIVPAIKALKNKSSSGLDDITVQQLKHMGPEAISWLLSLYNACIIKSEIPEIWKLAKTVAILKRGRPDTDPKSYRPISCLSCTYKLLERLLLNRLKLIIEPELIPEQYASRHNKTYSDTIIDLSKFIEEGYKTNKITSVVIVDPSAAYDTINVDRLLAKITSMINDNKFINLVGEMLRNRRFNVYLNHSMSSWRYQVNGLSQGSVLGPMLFNLYTNDLPRFNNIRRFIYVDDVALTTQTNTISEAVDNLKHALNILEKWYYDNALRPNPLKTKSGVFHHSTADLKLNLTWYGLPIEQSDSPKYLGVYLDRELKFRNHIKIKKP